MMLLRARTLAMGFSGVRPEVVDADRRAAQRRHHPAGARARLARRQWRPRPAGPRRPGPDRRGRAGRATPPPPGSRRSRSGPRRASPSSTAPTGCSACSCWRWPTWTSGPHGRHRRRHERRGAARHRPGLRRGPHGAAPAPRPDRVGRQPAPAARRQRHRRQPPHRRPPGAGRLLVALRPAGARRGPRHDGLRPAGRRRRAALGDRQPHRPARRPGGVLRPLPRRARSASPATSSPWRPPRSGPSPSGAPTGCSTAPARRACRRSSPRTPGVNSGLMIAQYTQAAMVAENRRLAAPASVDSLPTSAMQEDHVSMGWGAARKLRRSVANLGPHPRLRAGVRGPGPRAARSRCAGAGDRRRRRRAARRRRRWCRAPTGGWRPSSPRPSALVDVAAGCWPPVEARRRAALDVAEASGR